MSTPDLDVVVNTPTVHLKRSTDMFGQANEVDWTLEVTTILREGTASSHDQASNSDAAGWLTRGELDKDEYVRLLIILWHVYSCVVDLFLSQSMIVRVIETTSSGTLRSASSVMPHTLPSHPLTIPLSSSAPKRSHPTSRICSPHQSLRGADTLSPTLSRVRHLRP
jgi:Heme oxygenase